MGRQILVSLLSLVLVLGVACGNKDSGNNTPTTVVVQATPTPVQTRTINCSALRVNPYDGYYYDQQNNRYTRSGAYFYDRNNVRAECTGGNEPNLVVYDNDSCRSYGDYRIFRVGAYIYCVRNSYLIHTGASYVYNPYYGTNIYTYGWNNNRCDDECVYTLGGLGLGVTAGAVFGQSPEWALIGGVAGAIFGNAIGRNQ